MQALFNTTNVKNMHLKVHWNIKHIHDAVGALPIINIRHRLLNKHFSCLLNLELRRHVSVTYMYVFLFAAPLLA